MKHAAALLACAFLLAGRAPAAEPLPEHWQPVQRLVGNWSGTATGASGEGTVKRRYALVMNGRFIHETHHHLPAPGEEQDRRSS